MEINPIAYIHNGFATKFGLPRQSGLVDGIISQIVFEKEYRDENALRGLEDYSHLWLIWGFSGFTEKKWTPTVRPPRLGGNVRMGVFATRSPHRPNSLGLSSVKLIKIVPTEKDGNMLIVSGADLMDNTPIYDIKPYLMFTDSHKDAKGGFADKVMDYELEVDFKDEFKSMLPDEDIEVVYSVLAGNPRPAYHDNSDRVYGFVYKCFDIHFKVCGNIISVCEIIKKE